MNSQGHRIHRVTVKNFRGITAQRTVDLSGRHLFLLGPNGFGKSTIVEAIRWCLFGSPSGQQEIEVRNTFCPAETCDVVLELGSRHRTLIIRRQLTPGGTRSRQSIADSDGTPVLAGDAFPQLTRLGPPTGTQVIFAAQHAAGRRQAEISDFNKVLYFYLGVEDVPDFLERLHRLAEERRAQREEMSRLLDVFLQGLRNDLATLGGRKDEIMRNPPWGKAQIPTKSETERKIDDLLREVARLAEADVPSGSSCRDKLLKIKEWCAAVASSTNETLVAQLAELSAALDSERRLNGKLHEVAGNIAESETKITELQGKERDLLDGRSLEDLVARLADAEQEHSEAALRSTVRRDAAMYLTKYRPSNCPVCNTPLTAEMLSAQDDPSVDVSSSLCDELRGRISAVRQLRDELEGLQKSLVSSRARAEALALEVRTMTGTSGSPLETLERHIQNLDNAILSVRNQIMNAQAEQDRRDKRNSDLATEERFHYYQEEIAAIEAILEEGVNGARSAIGEYDSLLATAEEVGKLVLEAFDAQINAAIPPLAEKLTQVYARLTAHPSYDGVSILKQPSSPDRVESGKLELQVTSSRCRGRSFPANVLNGQAARALQLVPYFVFSDYWRDVMELDLLLVDDPSESFDTSHLDYLMSVLQSVASHTQLVVASHESDRMRPLINKYFPVDQRCIISVKDFNPLEGPTLEQQ